MKPTRRDRKVSGVKEEATRLHSKIIRTTRGPMCENRCGRPATDCAHIIGRGFSHTRTDLANAFALCATCHHIFGLNHGAWMDFVDATIGRPEYDRLWAKANAGVNVKFDWYDELDRLRVIAERIGLAA